MTDLSYWRNRVTWAEYWQLRTVDMATYLRLEEIRAHAAGVLQRRGAA